MKSQLRFCWSMIQHIPFCWEVYLIWIQMFFVPPRESLQWSQPRFYGWLTRNSLDGVIQNASCSHLVFSFRKHGIPVSTNTNSFLVSNWKLICSPVLLRVFKNCGSFLTTVQVQFQPVGPNLSKFQSDFFQVVSAAHCIQTSYVSFVDATRFFNDEDQQTYVLLSFKSSKQT